MEVNVFLDSTNYPFAELQCTYGLPSPFLSLWCIANWINAAIGPNFFHYFNLCISFGKNSLHLSSNKVEFPLQCVSSSKNSKVN